jgi:hypothetical protein
VALPACQMAVLSARIHFISNRNMPRLSYSLLISRCFFHHISIEDDGFFDLGCHREE